MPHLARIARAISARATAIYNLRAATNVTFRLTRDLSAQAKGYDLAASTIRMQARVTAFATDPPVYEWVTSGTAQGSVTFDAATGLCVFAAPAADMAKMPASLVYDCRLETPDKAIVPLFAGRLAFSAGVTRTAADSTYIGESGIGDTVTVDGERSSAPVALPVSITAAIAAAEAARDQAQAFMFPNNLALDLTMPGESLLTL